MCIRDRVELAEYQYLLPRLTGMWTHLERQGGSSGNGAIGSKGPGETQLETDRRLIHKKIDKLRADLEDVRRVRGTQRQQRRKNEIPVVAIVGYTNAGKSTLLNQMCIRDSINSSARWMARVMWSASTPHSCSCLLYTSRCV